jgi:2-keto-3-deoxy-L-rhamnonate aldolase RhmA
MIRNPVRKALLERTLTVGTWVQIGHPAVVEVLAGLGFDWLCADAEHTDIGPAEFAAFARGLHGRGPVPLVRVRENDTLAIRQMLDLGAQGVIVPLVNSAAEAEAAVRAAKYPPRGVRGFAFHRGNDWGAEFADYAAHANEGVAVVVMIESRQAVEDIDAILAVDGVDGVFIGPYDLSGSYGMPGRTADPVVRDACSRVVAACRNAGTAAGIHVVLPTRESIERTLAEGFTFVAVGVDTVFLRDAAKQALEAMRCVTCVR